MILKIERRCVDVMVAQFPTLSSLEDLSTLHNKTHNKRGVGLMGKVWQTGIPAISKDPAGDGLLAEGSIAKLRTGFVMSIIDEGFLKAMMVFLF